MNWDGLTRSCFIEKYEQIIDTLREINPNVTIYVQSILPVTKEKSDNDSIYNNPKIDTFNALLQKMCEEKEVYYVNVSEAVCDESGTLPADASFDGVHLNKESCQKWLEYLKTHMSWRVISYEKVECSVCFPVVALHGCRV